MRRTLALVLFVLAAGGLALLVGPREATSPGAVADEAPLLHVRAGSIRMLDVEIDGRRIAAARAGGGWSVADRPATPALASALEDLAGALASLQALDRFRSDDRAQFGLVDPRGRLRIGLARGRRELLLGATTPNGTALYARRARDPHLVVQVGIGLLSAIDRVFFFAAAQRPEIG